MNGSGDRQSQTAVGQTAATAHHCNAGTAISTGAGALVVMVTVPSLSMLAVTVLVVLRVVAAPLVGVVVVSVALVSLVTVSALVLNQSVSTYAPP